jgi:hypothetical protein
MLASIMAALAAAGRPMCRADLAVELGIDESALGGMLDTLVTRGRLRVIRSTADACGGCPIRSGCFIMADGVAATYALVPSASTRSCTTPDGGTGTGSWA